MFSVEGTYMFCSTNFTVGVRIVFMFLKTYLSYLIIFPKQLLKKKLSVLWKPCLLFSFFLLGFKNSNDIVYLIFVCLFFVLF